MTDEKNTRLHALDVIDGWIEQLRQENRELLAANNALREEKRAMRSEIDRLSEGMAKNEIPIR